MRVFRIAAAAREIGVSIGTLRELERRGLFKIPRDWSGQRVFTAEEIEEVRRTIFPDMKKGAANVQGGA